MRKLLLIVLITALVASCKKDPDTVPAPVVQCFISVQHHTIAIPYARVFVKTGTLVFPGTDTTLYDTRFVADANGNITFNDIPSGDQAFVFYVKGVDPGWDSTHVTPVWGYQYLMTNTHPLESKDYFLNIPVSE